MVEVFFTIFALVFVGVVGRWRKIFTESDQSVINNVVIYFSLPFLVFSAIYNSPSDNSVAIAAFLGPLTTFTTCLVAFFLGRFMRLPDSSTGALVLVSGFGNTGFFGYPLIMNLFGMEAMLPAVYYDLPGTLIPALTIALLIAARFGREDNPLQPSTNSSLRYIRGINSLGGVFRRLAFFPPVWGVVLALLLRGRSIPGFIMQPINLLTQLTTPLMMISLGLSIKPQKMASNQIGLVALALALKMVFSPLFVYSIARLLGLGELTVQVVTVQASIPPIVLATVYANKYHLDVPLVANTTAISMALSPVVVAALLSILF